MFDTLRDKDKVIFHPKMLALVYHRKIKVESIYILSIYSTPCTDCVPSVYTIEKERNG